MKLTKSHLKQLIKEELQNILLKEAEDRWVVLIKDNRQVGTFDWTRQEQSRYIPNALGEKLGFKIGSRIPAGTEVAGSAVGDIDP